MSKSVPARNLTKSSLATLGLAFAIVLGGIVLAGKADAAANGGGAAQLEKGRQLFTDWSCGGCHVLKDAGGTGHVGPTLDGDSLTKDFVVNRISNGQGPMPGFAGLMTDEEIDELAAYVVEASQE